MKCSATAKSTGKRCGKDAIDGGTVCRLHGGAAPQVLYAAAQRLRHAIHGAVANLIEKQASKLESVSLRATQDILDRNNVKGENLVRLMMPELAGTVQEVGLNDEQAERLRNLPPAELDAFLGTIRYIKTGVRPGGNQPHEQLRVTSSPSPTAQ